MRDSVKAAILNALTQPMTMKEMAERLNVSYKTVWRYMTELKNDKLVIEIPYGFGDNALRWQLAKGRDATDKFRIYLGKSRFPAREYIKEVTGDYSAHKAHRVMLGGGLAHLALRSYMKRQSQEVWPNPVDVKDSIMRVREYYKQQLVAIEQILLSDIFDVGRADIDKVFEIDDIDEFREAAYEFGDWKKQDPGPAKT